jgi:hypothetical protein
MGLLRVDPFRKDEVRDFLGGRFDASAGPITD